MLIKIHIITLALAFIFIFFLTTSIFLDTWTCKSHPYGDEEWLKITDQFNCCPFSIKLMDKYCLTDLTTTALIGNTNRFSISFPRYYHSQSTCWTNLTTKIYFWISAKLWLMPCYWENLDTMRRKKHWCFTSYFSNTTHYIYFDQYKSQPSQ